MTQPKALRRTRAVTGPLYAVVLAGVLVAGFMAGVNSFVSGIALMFGTAVLVATFAPHCFVLLSALALLFVRTLQHRVGIPGMEYLDEICVLVCAVVFPVVALLRGRRLVRFPGAPWFMIFVAIGVVSAVIQDVPTNVLISGTLLVSKGVLFGWAVAQVEWRQTHLLNVARYSAVTLGFLILCAAMNFAFPGPWNRIVLDLNGFGARYGLPPVTGPFVHPGYFGTTMALGAIGIACYRLVISRESKSAWLLILTISCAILSFRRKVLVGLAAAYFYIQSRKGLSSTLVGGVVAVLILVVGAGIVSQTISYTYNEYFVNPGAIARVRLTVDSIGIAFDRFPFGAGFGRFGSAAARADYSPEYYPLGYASIWGLGPTEETGKFLTDTFWPSVVGESGWIGTLAFLLGLYAIFRSGARSYQIEQQKYVQWISLLTAAWVVELSVESLAGAVFTAAPTYGLFFGAVGIATSARIYANCDPASKKEPEEERVV